MVARLPTVGHQRRIHAALRCVLLSAQQNLRGSVVEKVIHLITALWHEGVSGENATF